MIAVSWTTHPKSWSRETTPGAECQESLHYKVLIYCPASFTLAPFALFLGTVFADPSFFLFRPDELETCCMIIVLLKWIEWLEFDLRTPRFAWFLAAASAVSSRSKAVWHPNIDGKICLRHIYMSHDFAPMPRNRVCIHPFLDGLHRWSFLERSFLQAWGHAKMRNMYFQLLSWKILRTHMHHINPRHLSPI